MNDIGKSIMIMGIILAGIGLLVAVAGKIPGLGKLPGDIFIKKGNFSFYFPLATCVLISVILSLIIGFIGRK